MGSGLAACGGGGADEGGFSTMQGEEQMVVLAALSGVPHSPVRLLLSWAAWWVCRWLGG